MASPEQQDVPWPASPPGREYIRVGPSTTSILIDPSEAAEQFSRTKALQLTSLFEPQFLATLMRLSAAAPFRDGDRGAHVPGFREVEASPQRAGRVMNLALARPVLLRWLEQATGCAQLDSIAGRLTQTLNRPGDQLIWHDDADGRSTGRRLAIVINFSTEPYTGGEFQLRHKTGERLFQHHYTELSSAIIFRVDPAFEHRVLPLTAGGPRRVFAGWFCEGEAQ